MANLPLDLNQYGRSPFSLLGQLGATPSFVGDENEDEDPQNLTGDYQDQEASSYPLVSSPSAIASAGPRQKSQAELRSQDDYDRLRATLSQAPVATAPKWWQRAAGAAAGFGAGWSNAASRTSHPIDIGAMEEGIQHPGYRQKLQEWQSRVGPLQQVAGVDRAQADQERKDRQLDIQENWNKARAEAEHQRGVMWAARARAYDQGKITGKIASTPEERAAIADKYQFPPDMKQYYIANSNLTGYGATLANPGKGEGGYNLPAGAKHFGPGGKLEAENPKEFDPAVQASRELAQQLQRQRLTENEQRMSGAIEKAKADVEDKIRREREQLVKPLLAKYFVSTEGQLHSLKDPRHKAEALAALAGINQGLAGRLQAAQNQYASSIRQGGGTADDYDIDPDTLAASLRKRK